MENTANLCLLHFPFAGQTAIKVYHSTHVNIQAMYAKSVHINYTTKIQGEWLFFWHEQ